MTSIAILMLALLLAAIGFAFLRNHLHIRSLDPGTRDEVEVTIARVHERDRRDREWLGED